jgi:ornithine cyclodeaminase/alanine dehydrogenase-like protein (mu-crystallin family)
MPVLFLREAEVAQLVDMPTAIDAMREAFGALARETADNVPRVRAKAPGVVLHSLNAAAEYLGLVGWKQYTTTRHGARFMVGLHDAQSGQLVALLEADQLGQMRTGAVTGLAVELLAPPEADSLGLIGAGWQAESQLAAVAAVRRLREVLVYSRSPETREAFAQRMRAQLGVSVTPIEHPRRAVEYQPIVVTATSSKDPVFDGRWLTRGTLVCAMGSNWLHKAELDVEAVRAANLVVCDSIAACQAEAGDLVKPLADGAFRWQDAVELADVVAGKHRGRASADDIVIFKSVGLGIEDVALGAKVVERARERGLGSQLPI